MLWLLVLAGLALRVAVIQLRPEPPPERGLNEREYQELARNLAAGDGFQLHGGMTAYRDVLFPAVASLVLCVARDQPRAVLYLHALLSCATALLLYELGRQRFGINAGLLMCAVWMLYPAAFFYSALFLSETLLLFLWALALVIYDRLEANGFAVKHAALLGAVTGLVILTKATGGVLLAATVVYITLVRYEIAARVRWRAAAVVLLASITVMLPWMLRNAGAVGSFSLNTSGGIELLIGNNPLARGSDVFADSAAAMLPSAAAGEAVRDRAGIALARNYVAEHPGATLRLWPRKFANLWATDMSLLTHYYPTAGMASVAAQLRVMPRGLLILVGLPYTMLLLCGIAGYYLVRQFPSRGYFVLQIFLVVLASLVAYGLPRAHLPAMLALTVGIGALVRPQVWTAAPPWRRLLLLFTLGMFGGIWLFEVMTIAGV